MISQTFEELIVDTAASMDLPAPSMFDVVRELEEQIVADAIEAIER